MSITTRRRTLQQTLDSAFVPFASGESMSIRFNRASSCSRTRMSGSVAEDSSETRMGLISERYCGCLDAAADDSRRRVIAEGVDAPEEELEDAISVNRTGMEIAL